MPDDGDTLLDANGDEILDANGDGATVGADIDTCCWKEAHRCTDDTATGLWIRASDIPDATPVLKMAGDCYYFPGPSVPCPGPGRTDTGTWHADCAACEAGGGPGLCAPCEDLILPGALAVNVANAQASDCCPTPGGIDIPLCDGVVTVTLGANCGYSGSTADPPGALCGDDPRPVCKTSLITLSAVYDDLDPDDCYWSIAMSCCTSIGGFSVVLRKAWDDGDPTGNYVATGPLSPCSGITAVVS